jgi:predicted MFS family arabinose efflux permease
MTPQVLSIIQVQYEGRARARAIGAYSMVLAAGVAAGQVLGGLLVSLHLLRAAWRPALLLNVPIGASLLIVGRRGLAGALGSGGCRLDSIGAVLLSLALLALVVPLSLGRETGGPVWTWPCLLSCGALLTGFVAWERHAAVNHRHPLLDLGVLRRPGVTAGIAAVTIVMACYAGFLVSVTLHLQSSLGFSALEAGLIFAAYAVGFAVTSLAWTRAARVLSDRLPVIGPLVTAAALLSIGLLAGGGGWPLGLTTGFLFCAGAGHASAFSPLSNRLTTVVRAASAADLSGLIITASLVGQVLGVAGFAGIYLSALSSGSAHAFTLTAGVLSVSLMVAAACSMRAVGAIRAAGQDAPLDAPDPDGIRTPRSSVVRSHFVAVVCLGE